MQEISKQLLSLIRELIREELKTTDQTSICKIASVNESGSVDIYILPDTQNLIKNIPNASNSKLNVGDIVVLYKLKNKINNSFIIMKYNNI